MRTATRRAPHDARKPRPALTGRGSECLLGGDSRVSSTEAIRGQLLRDRFGLSTPRAMLTAPLIWGDAA